MSRPSFGWIRPACISCRVAGARDDVAELLSGPTSLACSTEVRRMFDYIIIDAPPLGIFTDANILIQSRRRRASGGASRQDPLCRWSTNCWSSCRRNRMLGVVLNRTDEQPTRKLLTTTSIGTTADRDRSVLKSSLAPRGWKRR